MIEARAPSFAGLARRLTVAARNTAEAHAESLLRARQKDPRRWRDARLLWPNHTGER